MSCGSQLDLLKPAVIKFLGRRRQEDVVDEESFNDILKHEERDCSQSCTLGELNNDEARMNSDSDQFNDEHGSSVDSTHSSTRASDLSIDDYDYPLPKNLVAQHPLSTRSDARLMLVNRRENSIEHWHVRDLPELLRPDDCLVFNDTKVVPAKLVGYRATTRGRWQGLFLEADEHGHLRLICKTRGQLQPKDKIVLQDRQGKEDTTLTLLARIDGGWVAAIDSGEQPVELMKRVGRVPLPHYIRGGNMVDSDVDSYQTVFAEFDGAVAAPTAGLHFTKELLRQVSQKGVDFCRLTLHVGLGTFRPIKADYIADHQMHAEWGRLNEHAAEKLKGVREKGGRIIAVGTTSVRVLETAAHQDDASDSSEATRQIRAWEGETSMYIYPPHQFLGLDALMTNFHFPKTSLLVLVRTFGGDELIKRAYEEAIEEEYRFFSYGDAMLIV